MSFSITQKSITNFEKTRINIQHRNSFLKETPEEELVTLFSNVSICMRIYCDTSLCYKNITDTPTGYIELAFLRI